MSSRDLVRPPSTRKELSGRPRSATAAKTSSATDAAIMPAVRPVKLQPIRFRVCPPGLAMLIMPVACGAGPKVEFSIVELPPLSPMKINGLPFRSFRVRVTWIRWALAPSHITRASTLPPARSIEIVQLVSV